jgi:hypothetical protein
MAENLTETLATPAGMRENNKNNQLRCQPALNVVVEIKGPFLGSVKPRTLDTDLTWRYRKRLRIIPGVTLNLGKTGALVSIGVRGGRASPIADAGSAPPSDCRALAFSYTSYDPYRHGSAAPQAAGLQPHQARHCF